jgi:hypothetical protein
VVFDENTFLASDKVFSASLPCARESTPILGKSTSPSPFYFYSFDFSCFMYPIAESNSSNQNSFVGSYVLLVAKGFEQQDDLDFSY